jgi:hypothetical protein
MKVKGLDLQVDKRVATRYLRALLSELGVAVEDLTAIKSIRMGAVDVDLNAELEYVQRNGRANLLQDAHDEADAFLSKPLSLGYNTDTGISVKLTSNYKGYTIELKGPGVIEAPELTIANDIIHFRRQAANCINLNDFSGVLANYRAYLSASISLVDCFLHRYLFQIRGATSGNAAYQNIEKLGSTAPLEERVEAWFMTFCLEKFKPFKSTKQWSQFKELKLKRNEIIHPATPLVRYKYLDVVKFLNYAKEGIGGLLAQMRVCANQTPNIGFIQSICHLSTLEIV